jgi:catechol-2,3-dioxygenase
MSAELPSAGTLGLRHLALNVADVVLSRMFYEEVFEMEVVWHPDADNVYLSSGSDNLALHRVSAAQGAPARSGALDHFGFIMASADDVQRMYRRVQLLKERYRIPIVKEPRQHRDGSFSFYLADPDGNVIQILYEPNISTPLNR